MRTYQYLILLYLNTTLIPTTSAHYGIFGRPLGTSEITITVPSTYSINRPLPPSLRKGILDGMCSMLVGIAGGVTAMDGHGQWASPTEGVVKETVTLLSVSLDSSEEVLREIYELAKWLAGRLRQEAILVKIDGIAYLVTVTDEGGNLLPQLSK